MVQAENEANKAVGGNEMVIENYFIVFLVNLNIYFSLTWG